MARTRVIIYAGPKAAVIARVGASELRFERDKPREVSFEVAEALIDGVRFREVRPEPAKKASED